MLSNIIDKNIPPCWRWTSPTDTHKHAVSHITVQKIVLIESGPFLVPVSILKYLRTIFKVKQTKSLTPVFICVCNVNTYVCGGQRTPRRSQFSPPTMWVPEINIRLDGKWLYLWSHPARSAFSAVFQHKSTLHVKDTNAYFIKQSYFTPIVCDTDFERNTAVMLCLVT